MNNLVSLKSHKGCTVTFKFGQKMCNDIGKWSSAHQGKKNWPKKEKKISSTFLTLHRKIPRHRNIPTIPSYCLGWPELILLLRNSQGSHKNGDLDRNRRRNSVLDNLHSAGFFFLRCWWYVCFSTQEVGSGFQISNRTKSHNCYMPITSSLFHNPDLTE